METCRKVNKSDYACIKLKVSLWNTCWCVIDRDLSRLCAHTGESHTHGGDGGDGGGGGGGSFTNN